MNLWRLPFIILFFGSSAFAADVVQHEKTSVPSSARFEFVQSALAVRVTFKLDKFTGDVWQIVRTKEDTLVWQKIPFQDPRMIDLRTDAKPISYQVFTSGVAVRHTYLLNIHTGASWQLIEDEDSNSLWRPLD